MENTTKQTPSRVENQERVRAQTAPEINAKIDDAINANVTFYTAQGEPAISQRINELDKEWDIERLLEMNASALAFTGLGLSALTGSKKWLLIPAIVLPFLFQHAVQGWCPPLPVLRRLGVRTRNEIDKEKYALKAVRGDFDAISSSDAKNSENYALKAVKAVRA